MLCGGGEGFTASTSDPDRQSSLEPSSLPLNAAGKPHLHPSIRGQETECMGNMNVIEEKERKAGRKGGKISSRNSKVVSTGQWDLPLKTTKRRSREHVFSKRVTLKETQDLTWDRVCKELQISLKQRGYEK